jgi:hypothetical protein
MTSVVPLNTATRFRLLTFLAGLALLIAGARWLDYPDWESGSAF